MSIAPLTGLPTEIKREIVAELSTIDIYKLHWADPSYSGVASEVIQQRFKDGNYKVFPNYRDWDTFWEDGEDESDEERSPAPLFHIDGPRSTTPSGEELIEIIRQDIPGLLAILHDMGMPLEGYTYSGWSLMALAILYDAQHTFAFLANRSPKTQLAVHYATTGTMQSTTDDPGLFGLAAYHGHEVTCNRLLIRQRTIRELEQLGRWSPADDTWTSWTLGHAPSQRTPEPGADTLVPHIANYTAGNMLSSLSRDGIQRAEDNYIPVVGSILHPTNHDANSWNYNPWECATRNKTHWADIYAFLATHPTERDNLQPMINWGKVSALMTAAEQRDDNKIKLLMHYGADPNYTAPDGYTAVHVLLQDETVHLDSLQLLMGKILNPNMRGDAKSFLECLIINLKRRRRSSGNHDAYKYQKKVSNGLRAADVILRRLTALGMKLDNAQLLMNKANAQGLTQLARRFEAHQRVAITRTYKLRQPGHQLNDEDLMEL